MSEVFVSYAREDRSWAEALVAALHQRGWDVWWDPELQAGNQFAEVIAHEIRTAPAVIVVWSQHSAASPFVHDEARMARDRHVLAPVSIDSTPIPLGFGTLHTPDLSAWGGRDDDPLLVPLMSAVEKLIVRGRERGPLPPPLPGTASTGEIPRPMPSRRRPRWTTGAGIAAALAVVVGGIALSQCGDSTPSSGAPASPATQPASATSTPPTDPPPPATPPPCVAIVNSDACGPRIRELEVLLDNAGFRIDPNDKFGGGTNQALRAFQRSQGFPVDATIDYGDDEWQALVALAANGGLSTIVLPDGGPKDVIVLQRWLYALGYYPTGTADDNVDGSFGDMTRHALNGWFAANGLPESGRIEVGGSAWNTLGEQAAAAPTTTTVPTTAPSTTTGVATTTAASTTSTLPA